LVPNSVRSPSPQPPVLPPPPPPRPPPPTPSPWLSPVSLEARASATLVDTYRLYVLPELLHRIPAGGYYTWIAQSMLRNITAAVTELLHDANGAIPHAVVAENGMTDARAFNSEFSPLPSAPASWQDGDDDAGSDDTDTDGSSVHTPSSSFFHANFSGVSDPSSPTTSCLPPQQQEQQQLYLHENVSTAESIARYTSLAAQAARLRQLLMLASANQAHEARETRHREAMLEIRCKRRAWLNKRLVTGISTRDGGIGMSLPFERSPLGLRNWLAEDVDEVDPKAEEANMWDTSVENDEFVSPLSPLSPLKKKFERMTLFPVSEEDEREFVERELDLDLDLDLEGGRIRPAEEDMTTLDIVIERPPILPRMRPRTSSMHLRRHKLDAFDMPVSYSPSRSRHLTSGSLLCQPLKCRGVDVVDNEGTVYGPGGYEEEFTLAMDLPLQRRAREIAADKGGEDNRRWIAEPPLGVVDCR